MNRDARNTVRAADLHTLTLISHRSQGTSAKAFSYVVLIGKALKVVTAGTTAHDCVVGAGLRLEGAPEPDAALLAALAGRRLLPTLAAALRVPAAHAAALVAAGRLPANSPAAAAIVAPLSQPLITGGPRHWPVMQNISTNLCRTEVAWIPKLAVLHES